MHLRPFFAGLPCGKCRDEYAAWHVFRIGKREWPWLGGCAKEGVRGEGTGAMDDPVGR